MIPEEIQKDSPIIFDGPRLLVREIQSFKAAHFFSAQRGWCTKTKNTYDNLYSKSRGDLYNFFEKPKEKPEAQLFISHNGSTEFKLKYNKSARLWEFIKEDKSAEKWIKSFLKQEQPWKQEYACIYTKRYCRNYNNLEAFILTERVFDLPTRSIDNLYWIKGRQNITTTEEIKTGYKWKINLRTDCLINIHHIGDKRETEYYLNDNNGHNIIFTSADGRYIGFVTSTTVKWFETLRIKSIRNEKYLAYDIELELFLEEDDYINKLEEVFEACKFYEITGGDVR